MTAVLPETGVIERLWSIEMRCQGPDEDGYGECGATPVTHILRVIEGRPCRMCEVATSVLCEPCAADVAEYITEAPHQGWRQCDHGVEIRLGVVPL